AGGLSLLQAQSVGIGGVLGARQALLQRLTHQRVVPANQGVRVQPEAGEDLTSVNAVRAEGQRLVAPVSQHKPVDGSLSYPPDDVFADAAAAVDVALAPEIVADTAGGD